MKDFKLKIDNSQESLNNSEWQSLKCLGGAIIGLVMCFYMIYGIQVLDILINN